MIEAGYTSIVNRLTDYFQRQTAWLEDLQKELERMPDSLQADDTDGLSVVTQQWEVKNKAFAEEFGVLKKEWDRSSEIPTAQREAMRKRAGEVESLIESVRSLYLNSAAVADEKSTGLKAELDELNIGREMLGKYRMPLPPDSGYFDSNM